MKKKKLEIVASYNNTIPGRIIRFRAAMKFWNRYQGDIYSHVSLSSDIKLDNMMSFARRKLNNPFNAGLIKEDIRTGMFKKMRKYSRIVVMQLEVTDEQYDKVVKKMNWYWENRDNYNFNFVGLISMLFVGKGVVIKNKFFCSQWVASVLQEAGIDIFDGKDPKDVRPFDFYEVLKDNIVYEGSTTDYLEYDIFNYDLSKMNSELYENIALKY